MGNIFKNEKKYIVFWTIWGTVALLMVRYAITEPIVQALHGCRL